MVESSSSSLTELDGARQKDSMNGSPKEGSVHDDSDASERIAPSPEEKQDPNLVTWDGPDDPNNPQNWPKHRKWIITAICCCLTVNVTFGSSAPTVTAPFLVKEFRITREVSDLITTLFLFGYVFGPLFWGPGSELYGRKRIFTVAMTGYTLFHLGQALGNNIETIFVTRYLTGFFAVAPLSVSAGVIADIWSTEGRGLASSVFMSSVFLGPVIGPIIGGFVVSSSLGWRWVFWIMMIFAGACTLMMIVLLPETYAPVILQRKAVRTRKANPVTMKYAYAPHEKQDWSTRGIIQRSLYRPVQMLYKEPILLLITLYLSVVYGLLYALFQALPIIFIEKRGFSVSQNGLVFIGVGLGTTFGAMLNLLFISHYPALIKKWKGYPPPEHRLFGAMVAGPTLVIGIFWLGWTGQYPSVPWYVPALSTILIGMSISLVFISFSSYMVDTYLMNSASAFAANTMIRSAVAASFPLFTVQMFAKMGVNWACTLFGFIAILLAASPFLFFKYGSRIRQKSTFAPCIDLRIAKELATEKFDRV